jgi:hypothetical protein
VSATIPKKSRNRHSRKTRERNRRLLNQRKRRILKRIENRPGPELLLARNTGLTKDID